MALRSLAQTCRCAALALAAVLSACGADTPAALIASGKEFSARQDHKAAAIQFKAALQMDPRASEARRLLGQAFLDDGDPENAAVELTRALDDKTSSAAVMPALTRALVLTGDYKKLVDTYGALSLDDKPAMAAVKANIATAWGALGNRNKTEEAVAASLAAQADYAPALILKARIAGGQRKFDEAAAIIDAVLARNDKLSEAWLLRGEITEFFKADSKAAEGFYTKALALEPANVSAHMALISMRIRERDIAGAKSQAAALRGALPNHPMTVLIDAQVAYLDKDFVRAREQVLKLLRVFPDRPGILLLGGAIEAALGSLVQAEAHFATAVQLAPTLSAARRNLAETQIRLGQYEKGLETLKPFLGPEARYPEALALAGDAQLRLGNAAAAERYFLLASQLDPDNTRLRSSAALARMVTGDPLPALADLELLASKSKDTYAEEAIFAARLKRREFDGALAAVESMAKKLPGNASIYELKGRVYVQQGDLVAARAAYEQAHKLDPALFAAVTALATIDMLEKKPKDALARLQASVARDARNSYALIALAGLKAQQGAEPEEVKALLSRAVMAAPNSADPRLELITYTLSKRQFKDSLAAAREALAVIPNDPRVLEAAGLAQMQAGDLEQAASTYRRLAAVSPASAKPYMRLADLYNAAGKLDQMEAALNKALELEPRLAAAQAALVELLVRSNRQRNALEYIQRVQQRQPDQPVGYQLEAAYYLRLKRPDAAVDALRKGLAKTQNPELAVALYKRLSATGPNAQADRFGAEWIRQHPQDAGFEYLLAESHIARGELPQAEARLKRVLAAYPNNPLALNNLAWVLVSSGKSGALVYAQRSVELLPNQPGTLDTLALALAAEKKFGPALDTQKRALELAPGDNNLRLTLAKIALQAGDKALAQQEVKRLQALGLSFPGHAEVVKLAQAL